MKKKSKKNKKGQRKNQTLVVIGDNAYHISSSNKDYKPSLAYALVLDAINISETNPLESLKQFNEGLRLMPDFLPAYISRGILKQKKRGLYRRKRRFHKGN